MMEEALLSWLKPNSPDGSSISWGTMSPMKYCYSPCSYMLPPFTMMTKLILDLLYLT